MMNNLLLEEGSVVHIENVSLSVASFAKFQPQSEDFLDITNPKAVYVEEHFLERSHVTKVAGHSRKSDYGKKILLKFGFDEHILCPCKV